MAATKKKLEVLFKANFPLDKTSDAAIKAYLEGAIEGIKIKAIETYSGKGSVKAVVTSNVVDLLLGNESTDDAESSDYRRGKSMSFMGLPPGFNPAAISSSKDTMELELKGKELSDLRLAHKKLEADFDALKSRNSQLEKQAKELIDKNQGLTLQAATLVKQIESQDNEKGILERKNRILAVENDELTQKLAVRQKIGIGQPESNTSAQVEAMEELISQKQKKFEEEKLEMQEKLAVMSVKLITDLDRTEKVIAQANKAENLEKAVAALDKEKQELAACLQAKESEAIEAKKACDEALVKLAGLEQALKLKEMESCEMGAKLKEVEGKFGKLNGSVKSLEKYKELATQEEEALNRRIDALEAEKTTLVAERERISAEAKAARLEMGQAAGGKEALKQAVADQQKIVREREETIRELKLKVKEKEDALRDIEAEDKASEKQVGDLKKKLAETEKKAETLAKQLKLLEKMDKQSDKLQNSSKQKIDGLEAEIKRKEKELKTVEETREQSQRELIVLQARFSSTEKALSSKNDEIRDLKARMAGGEVEPRTANSSATSATTELSIKEEAAGEASKLRKELDDEKLHNAQLNGRYLETRQELETMKTRAGQVEKELEEFKTRQGKFEELSKDTAELARYKKEAEELRAECKKLKIVAEEVTSATEQAATLQKQHELMVKENTALKASLFEAEMHVAKPASDNKLQIIEEIRGILAEVIYVYKTLDTNAKQFMLDFEAKKDRTKEFIETTEEISKAKKEIQLAKLGEMKKDVPFLRGFPLKAEGLKVILDCLRAAAEKKAEKLERYDDELAKFKTMLGVSKTKVDEYEQKLSFYY